MLCRVAHADRQTLPTPAFTFYVIAPSSFPCLYPSLVSGRPKQLPEHFWQLKRCRQQMYSTLASPAHRFSSAGHRKSGRAVLKDPVSGKVECTLHQRHEFTEVFLSVEQHATRGIGRDVRRK